MTGRSSGDIIDTDSAQYDDSIPPHKPYEVIGRVNFHDKNEVDKVIKEFESTAVNEKIETACVVSLDGTVYKCYGAKDRVYVEKELGYKLSGAIVSHNHPIEETEFSFSRDDLKLFMDYNLKRLRGCDEKYTYEFNRNAGDIDKAPKVWQTFENCQHCDIISKAKEYGVGYRRWKR